MASKLRILVVDDETGLLGGLRVTLRKHFQVELAQSGPEALAKLEPGAFAVIMTDMRMPGMSGAEFLTKARQLDEDPVRMVLTGQADLETTLAAVNDGGVFRIISKPCPPPALREHCEAALEQYRKRVHSRNQLQDAKRGAVEMLVGSLALTSPAAFGRAMAVRKYVQELQEGLGGECSWELECAAMLSQVGIAMLPGQISDKLRTGEPLSSHEQLLLERLPNTLTSLVGTVPGLEDVAALLKQDPFDEDAAMDRRLVALAEGLYEAGAGDPSPELLQLARALAQGRDGLEAAFSQVISRRRAIKRYDIPMAELRAGMKLAEDVLSSRGELLIARGTDLTPDLLFRLTNMPVGVAPSMVRIIASGADSLDEVG